MTKPHVPVGSVWRHRRLPIVLAVVAVDGAKVTVRSVVPPSEGAWRMLISKLVWQYDRDDEDTAA